MANKLQVFLNKTTGNRYWFRVQYVYKEEKTTRMIFDFGLEIGLEDNSDILNHKKMKQLILLHKKNEVKHLLRNEVLEFRVIAYLGRFKHKKHY